MKKNSSSLLLLILSVLTFASCKKTETNYNVGPKLLIVFDDDIDKVTLDAKIASSLNLKVGFNAPISTVRITSTYSVLESTTTPTGIVTALKPRSFDLGVFTVNDGVVMVTKRVVELRAPADGPLVGAGPTPAGLNTALYTRAINSYALAIDATGADGNTDRRFFTIVATQ